MDAAKLIDSLGIGLSRLLRYTYGGFLILGLASVIAPARTKEIVNALSGELVVLAALIVGAGLYAAHRSLVIPLHHLLGCLIFST